MKQTAIEWLHQTWGNYPDLWTWEKIQEWFEEAKQMEKKQIDEAWWNGSSNYNFEYTGEKYYQDTYAGDFSDSK